ncbi:MAG: hypothetical protein AAB525_04340 [Patescibacteria group bacterium]
MTNKETQSSIIEKDSPSIDYRQVENIALNLLKEYELLSGDLFIAAILKYYWKSLEGKK